MRLVEARDIAESLAASMRPFCERVEIAGSIRREKEECRDIEIVAVPRWEEATDPTDLFGETVTRRNLLFREWKWTAQGIEWIKPGTDGIVAWDIKEDGKYWRGYLRSHRLKLDLFLATPDNFGAIYLIRTGSAEYSHALVTFAQRVGCKFDKGRFVRYGKALCVPEEADVFEALGLVMPDPKDRIGVSAIRAKVRK